eukprot:jgi/Tetstr1/446987/TSEL_034445.t1
MKDPDESKMKLELAVSYEPPPVPDRSGNPGIPLCLAVELAPIEGRPVPDTNWENNDHMKFEAARQMPTHDSTSFELSSSEEEANGDNVSLWHASNLRRLSPHPLGNYDASLMCRNMSPPRLRQFRASGSLLLLHRAALALLLVDCDLRKSNVLLDPRKHLVA